MLRQRPTDNLTFSSTQEHRGRRGRGIRGCVGEEEEGEKFFIIGTGCSQQIAWLGTVLKEGAVNPSTQILNRRFVFLFLHTHTHTREEGIYKEKAIKISDTLISLGWNNFREDETHIRSNNTSCKGEVGRRRLWNRVFMWQVGHK